MDLLTEIAVERRAVADMLESLTDTQWDTPTLSAGWTVHHVAAHLCMPFRYSLPKIMWRMVKARGDFNKVADQVAQADAAKLSTSELVEIIRRNADHKFKRPGAGYDAPLSDIVVHGLDIRRPLGIERDIPAERISVVLNSAAGPKARKFYGNDISGVTFRASDTGWTHGSGPEVTGPAQDLALFLSGRNAGLDRCNGDGLAVLKSR